ncbi:MAG TPA: L,D-transpeptidase family protein [Clostridia bacterium]|nr:L,D-transpeptidase family protein [Clostridia bacterium]
MKRLIVMLCLLLFLNSTLVAAAAEQASVSSSTAEGQKSLKNTSISAAINSPEIDIKKISYKTELKKLGFLKEESKDAALDLRNAVIRFQASCNLTVTGKWSDKCLSLLAERLQTGIAACKDLIAVPPVPGKWIVINKTKRTLTLYEGYKVIQKYPVAIGNPPSRTPEDKYSIVSKVINPSWGGGGYAKPVKGGVPENPLGYRWLGLSYKNGSTLGIHGNNSPYSIGKNVSHGCIRMINSDVTQLFTVVPRSAPVWIGTDSKLKEWGVFQPEYASKAQLPAEIAGEGKTTANSTSPAGITVKPTDETASVTGGAIKVTYDEELPTTGGAIGIPTEASVTSTGGAVGISDIETTATP